VEGGGVAFFDFVVAWFVAHMAWLWVIVASINPMGRKR
jgi:hypothetical protein